MAPSSNQHLLQNPLPVFASEYQSGNDSSSQNRKKWENFAQVAANPPDRNAFILYEITGKQLEPALDSKVGGGEKSADSNMMGAPIRFVVGIQSSVPGPQSVSQGMCGLHAKMIKSTASLPPSRELFLEIVPPPPAFPKLP